MQDKDLSCSIKSLPAHRRAEAAAAAVRVNPVNAPAPAPVGGGPSVVLPPEAIVVLTSKYSGPAARELSVSFMEDADTDLRARILEHMNAWSATCGMRFAETNGTGEVRISLGAGGYWSYLGTDIGLIPENEQTMNLEGFSMNMPESEFHRVVRHETGHTMGFPHEHMRRELVARIDPQKAYAFFLENQGWDRQTVDQQVLTSLDDADIFGTPPDEDSVMCYQLPGSITVDGEPIRGGIDINATDAAFAGQIYPKTGLVPPAQRTPQEAADSVTGAAVPSS